MTHGTLAPVWFCVPVAAIMWLGVALHLRGTLRSDHPASRKRIRVANGILMLINLPLLAAGFSLIDPHTQAGWWVVVWLVAIALLAMSVALAVLDMVNTVRLARQGARDIARQTLARPLSDRAPTGEGAPGAGR